MWLPLQLVLEFLGRSAVWLAVMAGFGVGAALVVTALARRPWRAAWPLLVLAGLAGAVLGASLSHRFDWPEALEFRVWRRAVPLAWSAGGALVAAAAALLRPTGPAPTPPGAREGNRGSDAAPPPPGADTPPTADRPAAPPE